MMNQGPAIVFPLLYYVDFITTRRAIKCAGPVLSLKHQIRYRLPIHPLRIPMAVRPDLRSCLFLSNKRIVRRHCAVVVQPQSFTRERIKSLRQLTAGGVAGRDVELAVRSKTHTAAA